MTRLVVEVEHLLIYGEAPAQGDLEARIAEQLTRLLFADTPGSIARDGLAEAIALELWQALQHVPGFARFMNGAQA